MFVLVHDVHVCVFVCLFVCVCAHVCVLERRMRVVGLRTMSSEKTRKQKDKHKPLQPDVIAHHSSFLTCCTSPPLVRRLQKPGNTVCPQGLHKDNHLSCKDYTLIPSEPPMHCLYFPFPKHSVPLISLLKCVCVQCVCVCVCAGCVCGCVCVCVWGHV